MEEKLIKIVIIATATIIVVVSSFLSVRTILSQKDTINRLESNVGALQSDLVREKKKDGKTATTAANLSLTTSELKENMFFNTELKTLDIKPRDVKTAALLEIEGRYKVPVVHSDSVIIVRDTVLRTDTVHHISYRDEWIILDIATDSAIIQTFDSLTIINHAKTRRFLWWTWKKYSGRTTVKNHNPYSKIKSLIAIDKVD